MRGALFQPKRLGRSGMAALLVWLISALFFGALGVWWNWVTPKPKRLARELELQVDSLAMPWTLNKEEHDRLRKELNDRVETVDKAGWTLQDKRLAVCVLEYASDVSYEWIVWNTPEDHLPKAKSDPAATGYNRKLILLEENKGLHQQMKLQIDSLIGTGAR